MTSGKLKKKYLDFFLQKDHKLLPNVSLLPEGDSSTLFISAGMQPLVPYLLGEPHPLGKKLVGVQRCLRTDDIEKVGNPSHNTFFEMLGNWSLGDYWKEESIAWSFEFVTRILQLPQERISVTIFAGDENAPKDEESEKIWLSLGVPRERIRALGRKDNWWEAGKTGPGGPDSEIFFDTGNGFFEIWNNVFMEYNRLPDGSYEKLKQKNVDTGMGVERTTALLEGKDDIYDTELFFPVIEKITELSGEKYEDNQKPMRIIADHLRAAVFLLADGVVPAKVEHGYVLRRLIRRAKDTADSLNLADMIPLVDEMLGIYKGDYSMLFQDSAKILSVFQEEIETYNKTVKRADVFAKAFISKSITGEEAFQLYSTHGFSPSQLREKGYQFNQDEFDEVFKKHQEVSRLGAEKKFSGGLGNHSEAVTKLHTATHLLHQALRQVLGEHVQQIGSNITSERLRFDFTHPEKLTEEQVKEVEEIINEEIKENLPVKMETLTLEEAKKRGALAFFTDKYGDKVKVYSIGNFSKEVCGGPHVSSTGEIGNVKIVKEEAVGSGRRRIYARSAQDGSQNNFR